MEYEIKQRQELPLIVMNPEQVELLIPDCCRLGLPSCKHVTKEQRKVKKNIGM